MCMRLVKEALVFTNHYTRLRILQGQGKQPMLHEQTPANHVTMNHEILLYLELSF